MIILNDNRFSDEIFEYVSTKEDIQNSSNNSTLIFDYKESDLDLYKFCNQNDIPYGVEISSIKELIYISNLGAKYAICDFEVAKNLQKIADNYLIMTKIIVKSHISNIENIAQSEIDGIFVIKENK